MAHETAHLLGQLREFYDEDNTPLTEVGYDSEFDATTVPRIPIMELIEPTNNENQFWISKDTYRKAFTTLKTPFKDPEVIVASGLLSVNGTFEPDDVFTNSTGFVDEDDAGGALQIVLKDSQGNVLSSISKNPSFKMHIERSSNDVDTTLYGVQDVDFSPIVVSFEALPGASSVEFIYNNQIVAVKSVPGSANNAPVINSTTPIKVDNASQEYQLSFDQLTESIDVTDDDGDSISFLIDSVLSGTLTINGQVASVGDLISTGDILVWTSPTVSNGNLEAFSVRAFDGLDQSILSATVIINVSDFNVPIDYLKSLSRSKFKGFAFISKRILIWKLYIAKHFADSGQTDIAKKILRKTKLLSRYLMKRVAARTEFINLLDDLEDSL